MSRRQKRIGEMCPIIQSSPVLCLGHGSMAFWVKEEGIKAKD